MVIIEVQFIRVAKIFVGNGVWKWVPATYRINFRYIFLEEERCYPSNTYTIWKPVLQTVIIEVQWFRAANIFVENGVWKWVSSTTLPHLNSRPSRETAFGRMLVNIECEKVLACKSGRPRMFLELILSFALDAIILTFSAVQSCSSDLLTNVRSQNDFNFKVKIAAK